MGYVDGINVNEVTIQDCIDLYEMKNERVIINDGVIYGSVIEEWEER